MLPPTKYKVTQLIRSGDNDPVNVHWYQGDSLARAISVAGQALAEVESKGPIEVEVLEVNVEVIY